MPALQVTSPAGKRYKVTVPEGTELNDAFQQEVFSWISEQERAFDQSALGAFGSSVVQGATSAIAEPIRGVGELFESDYLTQAGENLASAAKFTAPVSPDLQDTFIAKAGQAVGQGGAQLGIALGTGGLGLGAKAAQASVLAPAFFAGVAGGADEAKRLGLEEGSAAEKLNQVLYGGAEALSESIFGLGSGKFSRELVSDVPGVLLRGAKSTAAKRFAKATLQEAAEEPIAGVMQDFSSRLSVEFGGAGDFTGDLTESGAPLRNPFDLHARGEETLYGAIGALPFGTHAALRRNRDLREVQAYRARVEKARKEGNIKPKDQAKIDALDAKAADFLETEGVPLMRNAAQSVIDGTAQGVVELKSIADNPDLSPAHRAAAQAKLRSFKAQSRTVVEQTDRYLKGQITFDELKKAVSDYDALNPYSKANQQKSLEDVAKAQAAAPVAAVAAANAQAGNTATAQALLDTQGARDRAATLLRQARKSEKQPAAAPAPAPATTPTTEETKASVPVAREQQIEDAVWPYLESTVQELVPQRVESISRALDEGDFETAESQFKILERLSEFRGLKPEVQSVIDSKFTPEQRQRVQAAREATVSLVKEVRKAIQSKAKVAGTPVANAVSQRVEPVARQSELSLNEPAPQAQPASITVAPAQEEIEKRFHEQIIQPFTKRAEQVAVLIREGNLDDARRVAEDMEKEERAAFSAVFTPEVLASLPEEERSKYEATHETRKNFITDAREMANGRTSFERVKPKVNDTSEMNVSELIRDAAARVQGINYRSGGKTTFVSEERGGDTAAGSFAYEWNLPAGISYALLDQSTVRLTTPEIDRVYDTLVQLNPELGGISTGEDDYVGGRGAKLDIIRGVASKFLPDNIKYFVEDLKGWADNSGLLNNEDYFRALHASGSVKHMYRPASVTAASEGGEGVRSENTGGQEAAATGEETPVAAPDALSLIDAEIAEIRKKRNEAARRIRESRKNLGFFGGDPFTQASDGARLLRYDLQLGLALLKKGYVKFKIWAREFMANSDEIYSIRNLRRVYNTLRDTSDKTARRFGEDPESISALAAQMDSADGMSKIVLAPLPEQEGPGYFGPLENMLDWAGNTSFFEDNENKPGAARSHKVFIEGDTSETADKAAYRLVYIYNNEVFPTGDMVVRQGNGNWAFQNSPELSRQDKFQFYSTHFIDAPFTRTEDSEKHDRLVSDLRSRWLATNNVLQFDEDGRLAFYNVGEVSRWASATRFHDGDFVFPVVASRVSETEIGIFLADTETLVGKFVFNQAFDQWMFGFSHDSFSPHDREQQGKFKLLGFGIERDQSVVKADTPEKIIRAWPAKPREVPASYNVQDGFKPAPMSPSGAVKPLKVEPRFKDYAELEKWIVEKRMRQGHKLNLNLIRRYVSNRGPGYMTIGGKRVSTSKLTDKALKVAERVYDETYPVETTELPVVLKEDKKNFGRQKARFVSDPAGERPLFTNNVFETAVQINMGYRPFVPVGFPHAVHPEIKFNPDTGEITHVNVSSGRVARAGDHLRVRQRDPQVIEASEARLEAEDDMNEAMIDAFKFVEGLPKAPDEDEIIRRAQYHIERMQGIDSLRFDRSLTNVVAVSLLLRHLRLEVLQPVVDATGYSANGEIVNPARLPQAAAAVGEFIRGRRSESSATRDRLEAEGLSTREVESILVLPDRFEALAKAAATNAVIRNRGGVNYWAYGKRAFRRALERYQTRVDSGFAAPETTVQYLEEGSEQFDLEDDQQRAAALVEGYVNVSGSMASKDDAMLKTAKGEEFDLSEELLNEEEIPETGAQKEVAVDLFGEPLSQSRFVEEAPPPVVEEEVPELTENDSEGETISVEPQIPVELPSSNFDRRTAIISDVVRKGTNKNQRDVARRILRGLPLRIRESLFNAESTEPLQRVLDAYYAMRSALIRGNHIRSEQLLSFKEALNLVLKNKVNVPELQKNLSPGTLDIFNMLARAHAAAPGLPKSSAAQEVVDHLGLVDGDPQSAIDALGKIAESTKVNFGTRALARRLSALESTKSLRYFSMVPTENDRGTFLQDRAAINVSPQGTAQDMAETLIHEFVHLATEQAFSDLEAGVADRRVQRADADLTKLREEVAAIARQSMGVMLFDAYAPAFEDNSEFVAYLFSDAQFNAWVSSRPKGFLARLVDAIRRLLGLSISPNTVVDRAWRATILMADRPAMFAQTAEAVSQQVIENIIRGIDALGANNSRSLLAGVNAQNIPEPLKKSFAKAQEMSANQEGIEKIRKETGWFRAPTDRQWRWEIPDKKLSLNLSAFANLRSGDSLLLGQLIGHDDFFEAYPEAYDILVTKDETMVANGSMNVVRDEYTPEGVMKVRVFTPQLVAHELQHWIQHKEGFFPGISKQQVRRLFEAGDITEEDLTISMSDSDPFFDTYRRWPGELEARAAANRVGLTEEDRRKIPLLPWFPVTRVVYKLRDLAAKGGFAAAHQAAEDTSISLSTERASPAWYDGRTDAIYFNPDIIAEETAGMTDHGAQEYMKRLTLHENIHRADNHAATAEEREDYMSAMTEADFEWIASRYFVDPAEREFALGRAPGMTPEQKLEERRNLMREHRRAMIELALEGETTEQFALFASSNPNLLSKIVRHISRFIAKLTAKVRMLRYNGSARDLRNVMETLNDIEEIAPQPDGEEFTADASTVAVPILSRRHGNYKVGGWATTGFLNKETAESERVRDANLRAMQTRVQMHRDDLASAIKAEYTSKGLTSPDDLINTALGSTENPVSPQQLAVAESLHTRAVRNAVSTFLAQQNLARGQSDPGQAAIIRENARHAYRAALTNARKLKKAYLDRAESAWIKTTRDKQAAAFAALLPETSKAVRRIRDDINTMQQRLLASGVLGPRTAVRVSKTFGIYLTRSYQVYNENMVTATGVKRNLWTEFLRKGKDPKAVALLDAARAAIFEDAVIEKAKDLRRANVQARNPVGPFRSDAERDAAIKAARLANPPLSSNDALSRARAILQSGGGIEVENLLEKYIEMGENMESDTDVLKQRDNIHPAIQALWGVYNENEYNAYNTMMKVNTLLANQKMFEEIYRHGKAAGYIFDKEGVYVDGSRTVPLGGTGTQANRNRFGILAGKYGPAELKAGLEEAFGGNASSVSTLWNTLRAITGYAMATKTKYSIQGTSRNFVGNVMFAAINLNLHKFFTGKARSVVARQLGALSKDKTKFDNYIKRLIELRVVSESAYEFRDLTKEFSQQALRWTDRLTSKHKKLKPAIDGLLSIDKIASRLHQGADDFWKVLSFEGELARVKRWEPNLTQEQAEEKAAWKIRHTMPTYTEAFYFIKRLRQQPFISPFITFTAEVYRTIFGTIRVGLNEISEGHANGRPGQALFGLTRVLNMAAAVAIMPQLVAMLGKAAFGAGDDDKEDGINPGSGEEALSRFAPEYMRNNSLMRFSGNGWNEQIYMDTSYLLPQDVVGKVVRMTLDAFMKPETTGVADKAAAAGLACMTQVMEPVTKDQLFFGSVMQAKFNYNQAYDRKIYKDTDTTWAAATAIVNHIYTSALEPGTLRTGRLIMEAADGTVRDGLKLEVANEMLGVAGIKKRTIILDTRFTKNADQHKAKLGEAATHITGPMQSNSSVEDADITRGYERANEVRMDTLREARRDYLAAMQLGMPQGRATALLRDSQLTDDEVAMVVGNFYVPYQVSDQVFEKAAEKSKAIGQDRLRLYLDAFRQQPKRQPLIPE